MADQPRRPPRPRIPTSAEIKRLAMDHSEDALQALVELMNQRQNLTIRFAAAQAILDRGHGKPKQSVEVEHVTEEGAERRRALELLAAHHPAALEALAGWAERVEPPALPAPSPLPAELGTSSPAPDALEAWAVSVPASPVESSRAVPGPTQERAPEPP